MKWIYWLSAFIVALALVPPDIQGLEAMRGTIPAVVSILLCLAAYYFAARRACAGLTRGAVSLFQLAKDLWFAHDH